MTNPPSSVQAPEVQAIALPPPADEAVFRHMFQAEFRYVWSSLRRLGVPPRDLEDVAHEVFLEVHRQFQRYDQTRPARPWLFAFALRFAADYRKQARVRYEAWEESPEPVDPAPAADIAVEKREARELVAKALLGIDFGRRPVFILFELDQLPMTEIAALLEIPVNTAFSRLRLAREEFAAAVRRIQAKRGAP